MYGSLKSFFVNPLVSVLTGAVVTWLCAWFYYKKAGDELKAEASRLQRTTELILRWLEAKGENVSVIRQSDGTPTGLAHNATVLESLNATESCQAVVTRGPNRERP
jgi:hypothetical protein